MEVSPDYFGLMPVKKISREEARAMWPSEAETKAAEAERAAVVKWLEREADESRQLLLANPESEMAPLYGHRALYYQQASGYIRRGTHLASSESRQHFSGDRER